MRHNCGVECVEVLTRRAVCTEFATSSRRLPTNLVENLETEHVENLRILPSCGRVVGVYAPVGCRDPVYDSAAIGYHDCRIVNWVTTADGCVHTGLWFTPPTRLNSTVASCRRRRCVLGLIIAGGTFRESRGRLEIMR